MILTERGKANAVSFLRANLKPEYAEFLDDQRVLRAWFSAIENSIDCCGHFELDGQYTVSGNPVVTSFTAEDGEIEEFIDPFEGGVGAIERLLEIYRTSVGQWAGRWICNGEERGVVAGCASQEEVEDFALDAGFDFDEVKVVTPTEMKRLRQEN